jgi:hypothetical protein
MSQPAFASVARRTLAYTLLLGTLAVGVAACGSSSSAATSGGSSGSSGSSGSQFQARLNFAKCMRQHGINIPDPSSGGGPAGGGGAFRTLRNYPQAQRQAALQACQSYLSKAFGNISPAQSAQFRQQLVKYAQCMRSHGIDIPDPTTSTAGGGFALRQSLGSVDRNSPAFQAANKACASLRPRFGGRGGGPGGGPGPGGTPGA